MKNMNVTLKALLTLSCLLLASCKNFEGNSSSTASPFLSPDENKVHINPMGEKVIKLDPVNFKDWKDPELQALELKIRESRKKRVEEKLANLKEERLYFSNPLLVLKENGQEEVSLDVKFKDGVQKITFLSPKDHGTNFYFKQIAGFADRKVKLQGMCLDEGETCNKFAVQVSYIYKRLRITEQFIMNTGLEDEEPQQSPEVETDDLTTIDGDAETETPPLAPLDQENDSSAETDLITLKDNNEDTALPIETNDEEELIINIRPTEDKNPIQDVVKPPAEGTDLKTETEVPVEAPSENSTQAGEVADEEVEVNLDHSENNKDLVTGDGQIIFPDIKEDQTEAPLETDADEEFNINSGEANIVLSNIPIPTPRPEPDQSPSTSSSDKAQLSDIQNTRFNQSRGFYSFHAVRGRISSADQLDKTMRGAVVNPSRRTRHYASGMTTSLLEFAADKLHSKYPKSPLCINDLSSKNGGKLGGHGSHRNGLDADISYPSTSNQCKGNFFHSWNAMNKKDSKFMEKNWFLINTLLDTERVHVIFVSRHFAKALCTYVKKTTNLSKSSRNKIFKKLHHIDNHHHHYHVRLKCNKQNPGCVTQGVLTGLTCN